MALIAGIDPLTGQPRAVVLTTADALPVEEVGPGGDLLAHPLADLLTEMVWEQREMRRLYCEATDQLFHTYPG